MNNPIQRLLLSIMFGLFIVNICFIQPAVTFVCYYGSDSCNQN